MWVISQKVIRLILLMIGLVDVSRCGDLDIFLMEVLRVRSGEVSAEMAMLWMSGVVLLGWAVFVVCSALFWLCGVVLGFVWSPGVEGVEMLDNAVRVKREETVEREDNEY